MSTRTALGGPRATVAAHGLRVHLPERWEARLFLRDATADEAESVNPVLHLANFALPPGRGDFGSGAVEKMGAGHAFVALLEYDSDEAGTPLFAARGVPRPVLRDFARNALQRPLRGQLGYQRFFTEHGRAFCLYVVLGSPAAGLVGKVHGVLDNIKVIDR
ncbi:MAG TPA: hypothetical protein VE442_02320 [Jatrophihabitans sp.]|jgi:hypothetical protein|nr:hypothetical protein [Jatrophihabitans sp.]